MKNILLLFIIGTIWSCSKQEYNNSELDNSEFQPYLNTFLEEARIRGYDYTANNINFYLADIEDEEIRGLCYQRRERIIIDRDKWENSTDIIKERLIFHELGHCILGRSHRNDKSLSGECLSLMDGAENDFSCSENVDSELWREYYIDELFDRNTVLPKWYTDNRKYVSTYTNQSVIVSIVDLNTDFYSIPFDFSNKEKFVIEFTFKDWNAVRNNIDFAVPKVVVGGVIIRIDPFYEVTGISFYREPWGLFFDKRDYKFQKNIKLTIRKNNDLLQFFFDEQLMHITENIPFNKNVIEAYFYYPINMDIEIFEFE